MTLHINNCLFDGTVTGSLTNRCGGFVGWRSPESTLYITNSLMAGTLNISIDENSATFSRNGVTPTNSYYTSSYGIAQGTAVNDMTNEQLCEQLGDGWTISGNKVVPITESDNIYSAKVSSLKTYYMYSGAAITPTVTVTTQDGTALTEGTDYTIAYIFNNAPASQILQAGEYTAVITGTGNYTGTKKITFTVGSAMPLTSDVTVFEDGYNYTLNSNVAINSRITVEGTVNLTLAGNYTLTVPKGIELPQGTKLVIDGSGTLTINDCNDRKSGIGGTTVGTLIINGGTINVTGGSYAAGIGGDTNNSSGGVITINDGVVNARGGSYGSGIGGGYADYGANYGHCGVVTINGGQITATGGSDGFGIGPGSQMNNYDNGSGSSLILGWKNTSDFISLSNLNPRLAQIQFAEGKDFIVESTNLNATTENIMDGAKLLPKTEQMNYDLQYVSVAGVANEYNVTGQAIAITPVLTDVNGVQLTEGTDYTTKITFNGQTVSEVKHVGEYTYTFTAVDGSGHTGAKTLTITVNAPAAPENFTQTAYTDATATLSWNSVEGISNWQIQYSTSSDFSNAVTVNVSGTASTVIENLTPDTIYYARVMAIVGEDNSEWSDTATFETTTKVWIGMGATDSSSALPTSIYYNYSTTEQIYTADEIGKTGMISDISFFLTNTNQDTPDQRTMDIYMVLTDYSNFNDGKQLVKVAETDRVFSGTASFHSNSWGTITLDQPFYYDGTKNLLLVVHDKTGTYRFGCYFLTKSSSSDHMALEYHNDNKSVNPTDNSYTGVSFNSTTMKNAVRMSISDRYTVTVSQDIENGTVTADRYNAINGQKITLNIAPSDGYAVRTVTVNGEPLLPVNGVYSFNMPAEDVTISATFRLLNEYTVTFIDGENTDTENVTEGQTVAYRASANQEGKIFAGWYNGESFYDFATPISGNLTLTAEWINADQAKTPAAGDILKKGDVVNFAGLYVCTDDTNNIVENNLGIKILRSAEYNSYKYVFSDPESNVILSVKSEDIGNNTCLLVNGSGTENDPFTFEVLGDTTHTVTWIGTDGSTVIETDTDVYWGTYPHFDGTIDLPADNLLYWSDGTNFYYEENLPKVSNDVTYTAMVITAKLLKLGTVFTVGDTVECGSYYFYDDDDPNYADVVTADGSIDISYIEYDDNYDQYVVDHSSGAIYITSEDYGNSNIFVKVKSGTGTKDDPFSFEIVKYHTVNLPANMELCDGYSLTNGMTAKGTEIKFRAADGYTASNVKANDTELTPRGGVYSVIVSDDMYVTADLQEISAPYVSGASLTLKGDIDVNIYLKPSADLDTKTAYVMVCGPDDTNGTRYNLMDLENNAVYGYKISCLLTAQQMGESITVHLFDGSDNERTIYGSDRTTAYEHGYTYGPKNYFATVTDGESYSANLKALVKAMENYGEYAREYFGNKTAVVCTPEEINDVDANTLSGYAMSTEGTAPADVKYYGSSLLLKSKTSLRFYFDNAFTGFTVTDNNGEAVAYSTGNASNKFYIEVSDISAKDLDKPFTVTVGEYKITASAMTYAYNALTLYAGNPEKTALCNLAKSLYKYNIAAKQLFEN